MKHSTLATALLVLFLTPVTTLADGGFYLGGSVGSANLTEDFDGLGVDANSTSFRVVGGWQLNHFFALEGGYHSFGTFEDFLDVGGALSNVSVAADGYTLGATGTLAVSRSVSLFGRAGAFYWDADAVINDITVARPEDSNLYVGAGGEVAMSERLSIVGDWTRYELEDTDSDVYSIGFKYRF